GLTQDQPGYDRATDVIWPETAFPFFMERMPPEYLEALGRVAPRDGLLITGTPRGRPPTGPLEEMWNSMVGIDASGRVVATADKFHLVPMGEYVPFRDLFP